MTESLTIRQRLTMLFTAGFLLSGMVVQAIVFWRLDARLRSTFSDQRRAEQIEELGLPSPSAGDRNPFVLPDGRTLEDVLVAAQQEFRSETLTELAIWSGVALALTAITSALLGRWLAGRALQPMERLTDATQWITASSLDTRLDWVGPQDEVAELAATIDDMLERIEDGVAAQRQFAAMASHELRTPLSVIELEADLAVRNPGSTTTAELALRTGAAATRARELVTKLLQLARSQSGIQRSELVELWHVVDRTLTDRLALADERRISVEFEPGSGTVRGDRSLLDALAANLIENGIRHNHEGGILLITTTADGSRSLLRVENSGPALDLATLERMDQPFRRGDDNPDSIGHGLGLTIVRTIVDRHDGSLHLEPRTDGGLIATVSLPAR